MIFDNPIPVADNVSLHPILITTLSRMAFPDPFEFMIVIDKLIDQAANETFNPKLSYKENEKLTEVRYFQLLWKAILEKGRDNNV